MNLKKIAILLLITVLTGSLLLSCGGDRNGATETDSIEIETVEPIDPELMTDYTDDETTRDKLQALQASFEGIAPTPSSDFDLTVTADGNVTVTKYKGSSKNVRVPESVEGKTVTAIGDSAFAENTTLEALYLPDSIQSLGEGILTACESLTALRTPLLGADAASEQYLGFLFGSSKYADNARDVPATLSYLELGGTAKKLADFALFDCNDLICVTLPEGMTGLGTYSLYSCSSLQRINTEHLTEIADHAMDGCTSLTFLELGTALQSVGLGALEGCMGLRTLILPFVGGTPTENTYLGYLFGAEAPELAKGYYPTYLSTVKLLSTCKTLGNYAFYQCQSLTSIELPETLAEVGIRAFNGCVRLKELRLPSAVKAIRENAFLGCISLSEITFAENSALESVGVNAFYGCSALIEIKLPQALSKLSASCFADCFSLETVDLGGVESVEKNAFRNCRALKSLTARDGVRFADGNAYAESLLGADA